MRQAGYRIRYAIRGHLLDPMDPPGPFEYVHDGQAVRVVLSGETRTLLEFIDARVLADPARSVGLADAGDLIRAAWPLSGTTGSVFLRR